MKVNLYAMKDQKSDFFDVLSRGFLSFFGTGHAPKAPGTVGSLATIPFIFALSYFQISFMGLACLTLILFIAACIVADKIQKKDNHFDPGWIVIDEVIGMLITWMFIFPSTNLWNIFLVFGTFRIFDIVKIWPASFFDKRVKNGFATIFDDVISAIYAGLFLMALNYFHLIN